MREFVVVEASAPYYTPPSPDYTPTAPQLAASPPAQEPELPAVAALMTENEQEAVVVESESRAEGGASEQEEEEVQEQEGEGQASDTSPRPSCDYSELQSDNEENDEWGRERVARLTRFQAIANRELQALKIFGEDILKGLPVPPAKDHIRIINKISRKLEKWGEVTVEKYGPKGLRAQEAAQKRRKAVEREIKKKTRQLYPIERELIEKHRWIGSLEDRTLPEERWWPADLKEGLELTVLWAKREPQFQVNARTKKRGEEARRHIATTTKEVAVHRILNEVCRLLKISSRVERKLINQLFKKDHRERRRR